MTENIDEQPATHRAEINTNLTGLPPKQNVRHPFLCLYPTLYTIYHPLKTATKKKNHQHLTQQEQDYQ